MIGLDGMIATIDDDALRRFGRQETRRRGLGAVQRDLLDSIRSRGPMTTAELIEDTGRSRFAVWGAIRSLLQAGLVKSARRQVPGWVGGLGSGRQPNEYEITAAGDAELSRGAR
jgi:hypothetical protein